MLADEPEAAVRRRRARARPRAAAPRSPSLLGDMPGGVEVGTFVHRVLEATDFAAADLDAELRARVAEVQARRGVDVGEPATVVAGLRAAIETPLGRCRRLRLRDLARADRLDELDFELPLVGGDEPTGRLTLEAIAAVLRAHLPAGDPLAGYAERLADPALRAGVRGYLTGSIDLVGRRRRPLRDRRLQDELARRAGRGADGVALPARPRSPPRWTARHYALQALLYTVALHRYLRWRLPGYDPERAPRRRALPVPARDERRRRRRRRRHAVRRLRLAPAGRAGRRR